MKGAVSVPVSRKRAQEQGVSLQERLAWWQVCIAIAGDMFSSLLICLPLPAAAQ
jgi:hypothetical protein